MRKRLSEYVSGQNFLILIFLISISLFIGLISLHFYHFIGADGGGDGIAYVISGKNLFSGGGLSFRGGPQLIHPPFYSILIGIFWFLTKNLEFSGQIVSILAASLLIVPVYYLAKEMYGRKVALLSGIFSAIFPALVYASTEIRCESLYTLLLMSSVFLGWKVLHNRNIVWVILLGVMMALAYLTHPIGIIFLPMFIILFLFSKFFVVTKRKLILVRIIFVMVSFIIVSLPYWLFIYHHTGRWTLSGNTSYNEFSKVESLSGDVEKDSFILFEEPAYKKYESQESSANGGMLRYIITNPGEIWDKCLQNLKSIYPKILDNAKLLRIPPYLLNISLLFILLFIGVKLFIMIKARRFTMRELYLIIILLSASAFLLFHIEPRYFFPYIPIILLGLSKVTVDIQEGIFNRLSNKFNRPFIRISGFVLPGILILGMSLSSAWLIAKKQSLAPYEYKIMGLWMKENIEDVENKVVMSRKGGVPFYANCKWNALYYGDYQGMIKYAKSKGVDYLIIDEYTIPRLRPQFAFLLDEDGEYAELKVIHMVEYKGRKTILYHIKKDSFAEYN